MKRDDGNFGKHLGCDRAEALRRVRDEDVVVLEQEAGLESRRRLERADGSVDPAEIDLFREVDPGDGFDYQVDVRSFRSQQVANIPRIPHI